METESNKYAECHKALYNALKLCAESGYIGGVYDGIFCLWPKTAENPHEGPTSNFFENVMLVGGFMINSFHGLRLDDGGGN